jgi:hypothetical protein
VSVLQSDLELEDFLAGLRPEVVLLDWQRHVLEHEFGSRWLVELLEHAEPVDTTDAPIEPAGITLDRALAIANRALARKLAAGDDVTSWGDQ